MVKLTKHIPNFITSLNLFSGSLAIVMAFENKLVIAAFLIFLASVFDFLDGMSARALKAYSNMGKELDSLADMISFGFAPSAILFSLMKSTLSVDSLSFSSSYGNIVLLMLPFIVAVFSGLRLAKFNVDTRQTESFIGLPTPANAIFIASLPLILHFSGTQFYAGLILNVYTLSILIIVLSFLLVAEFPMFSLKFKNLKFNDNKLRFVFLLISLLLIIVLQLVSIPIIIFLYIILSAINNWII